MAESYRPRCPNCGSANLYAAKDYRSAWDSDNSYVACYPCGWRLYGEERIQSFVENQKARWEADQVAKAELIPQETKAERRRRQKREWARRKRQKERIQRRQKERELKRQAAIERGGLYAGSAVHDPEQKITEIKVNQPASCAASDCDNPSRPRSKYCSRLCSNRMANRAHLARKRAEIEAQKRSPEAG